MSHGLVIPWGKLVLSDNAMVGKVVNSITGCMHQLVDKFNYSLAQLILDDGVIFYKELWVLFEPPEKASKPPLT